MKVGTAEPLDAERKRPKTRSSRLTSGGPGNRNKNNGGGGGGDDGGYDRNGGSLESQAGDKAKVLTWFLLLVVLMTFGGLAGAYVVVATNRTAEWKPFEMPIQIWVSTVLILASSFSYHKAKLAFDDAAQDAARKWLVYTACLGGAFISSQLILWLLLTRRGLYMSGNPYAGFFYILTAAHAVHVAAGIAALGWILLRSWLPTMDYFELAYRQAMARSIGWYWHFMGLLWIALFVLLGSWK